MPRYLALVGGSIVKLNLLWSETKACLQGVINMKKDIHPEYVECTVKCSCGNTFTTRSTKSELRIDLCNKCHPFFTGQQKFVDTGGRVQRFSDKYGSASAAVFEREEAKKAQKAQKAAAAEAEAKAAREAKAAAKAKKAEEYAKKAAEEEAKAAAAAAEAAEAAPAEGEAATAEATEASEAAEATEAPAENAEAPAIEEASE